MMGPKTVERENDQERIFENLKITTPTLSLKISL